MTDDAEAQAAAVNIVAKDWAGRLEAAAKAMEDRQIELARADVDATDFSLEELESFISKIKN